MAADVAHRTGWPKATSAPARRSWRLAVLLVAVQGMATKARLTALTEVLG